MKSPLGYAADTIRWTSSPKLVITGEPPDHTVVAICRLRSSELVKGGLHVETDHVLGSIHARPDEVRVLLISTENSASIEVAASRSHLRRSLVPPAGRKASST